LLDYGIRAVIAPSFADIFYNNCFKNGILPIRLDEHAVEQLFQQVSSQADYQLDIDLEIQTVTTPAGERHGFEIAPHHRHNLLHGLDDIGLTLQHADAIRAYEARRRQDAPGSLPAGLNLLCLNESKCPRGWIRAWPALSCETGVYKWRAHITTIIMTK